jgi:Mrp family chromosome partitioning ATPase/capsular polysaccharide biosynthesis protein
MELAAYLRVLRRWFWLIGLASVIFGSASFVVGRTQPPRYQASATIQVGSFLSLANPNTGLIQVGQQLAQNYAAIVTTYPVLEATVNKLQLPFPPEKLETLFQTRIVPNTSLLVITVTYTDPVVVADIANELANQLILNSPTNLTKEQQDQVKLLREELARAQAQLKAARDENDSVERSLSQNPTEQDRKALEARRDALNTQINSAQANLAQLSNTLTALEQQNNSNTLTIVEPARIPTDPVNPNVLLITLLAMVVGALLAAGAAFLIEYLNDSVRSPAEILSLTGVPLLGSIAPFGKKRTYKDKLITWTQPRSMISEAYRALRVNLMYAAKQEETDQPFVYSVTSPSPSEGKSVTTANLATIFASTGMSVLLIDADLRRPTQHLIFEVSNTTGLTDLLSGLASQADAADGSAADSGQFTAFRDSRIGHIPKNAANGNGKAHDNSDQSHARLMIARAIQKTRVPGLELIPAGLLPTNPAELLGTAQMQTLMRVVATEMGYDVVLLDSPPSLTVSDSTILAGIVDGTVIVVLEAGRTRRAAAVRTVEQFRTLSLPVAGIVLNRLNPRDVEAGYGYSYHYYYGYYGHGSQENAQPSSNGHRPVPALLPSSPSKRSASDGTEQPLDD